MRGAANLSGYGPDVSDEERIFTFLADSVSISLAATGIGIAAAGAVQALKYSVKGLVLLTKSTARLLNRTKTFNKKLVGLCFVKGTLIHTKDGLKPIEEIKVGDLVASKNETTGEINWEPVVRLFRNKDRPILNVSLADSKGNIEVFGATLEHPFRVKDKGWVGAENLKTGDKVVSINNTFLTVKSVVRDSNLHFTYNFEVADSHNYFVGKAGVWVHNTSKFLSPNQLNKIISRGQAPRGITRVDVAKVKGEKLHVHFDNKSALNIDGTWKHGGFSLSKRQKKWLSENGWTLPKE